MKFFFVASQIYFLRCDRGNLKIYTATGRQGTRWCDAGNGGQFHHVHPDHRPRRVTALENSQNLVIAQAARVRECRAGKMAGSKASRSTER